MIDQPYLCRIDYLATLTPRQTFDLYGRPRDKDGNPLPIPHPDAKAQAIAERNQFLALGEMLLAMGGAGFTREQLLERANKPKSEA